MDGVNEQQVNNTLFVSNGGEVAVQELSEEEGVDAIKKWLEENSCPSKSLYVLPGSNSGAETSTGSEFLSLLRISEFFRFI